MNPILYLTHYEDNNGEKKRSSILSSMNDP